MSEADGELRLRSPSMLDPWEPGSPFVFACLEAGHSALEENCSCGVYAAKEPAVAALYARIPLPAERLIPKAHAVIGRVSLWGRVIECERGWRASFAYPACLFVPQQAEAARRTEIHAMAEGLRAYGVPVLPFIWPDSWGPLSAPGFDLRPQAA